MEINKAKEGDWFVDSTGNRWDIVGQEGDCLLVNDPHTGCGIAVVMSDGELRNGDTFALLTRLNHPDSYLITPSRSRE